MPHLPNIDTDFQEWYEQVCIRASLVERPPDGHKIVLHYGTDIWDHIKQALESIFKKRGVENVVFLDRTPMDHFDHQASRRIVFGHMKRHIKSYKDLPIRWNQWGSVFLAEPHPHPFVGPTRFWCQAGHSAHASDEAAMQ